MFTTSSKTIMRRLALCAVASLVTVCALQGHPQPAVPSGSAPPPDSTPQGSAAPRATSGLHPELALQLGHSWFVSAIAFSPDGKRMVSASWDATLKLWDVSSGELLRTLSGHTYPVYCVAFAPDGQTIASGSGDGTVKLWDGRTGALKRTLPASKGDVKAVAFSPDSQVLASGGDDTTIKLWDVQTGQLKQTRMSAEGRVSVKSLQFSSDGGTLVSGVDENEGLALKRWDARTGGLKQRWVVPEYRIPATATTPSQRLVNSFALSPDGKTLVTGGLDGTVKVWDVQTRKRRYTLAGHKGAVLSFAFAPDGSTLASTSMDHTVRLWDMRTGKPKRTLPGQYPMFSAAFSPDGKTLATGSSGEALLLWDARSGARRRALGSPSARLLDVALSSDGKTLASASSDKTVRLWNIQTGEMLHTLTAPTSVGYAEVTSVAFSPDGKTLASGSQDRTLRVWNVRTGKLLRTLKGCKSWVSSVAFSPDGRTVAGGSWDKTVKLWDVRTGKLLRTLSGHRGGVLSVVFSPDGRTLASAGVLDKTVRLWDVRTGKLRRTLMQRINVIRTIAFSPDGKTLASGGALESLSETTSGEVALWDVHTGALNWRPGGQRALIASVAFSRDGKLLAGSNENEGLKLWDARTGKLLRGFAAPDYRPTAVAITSNGKTLASSNYDGTIKLWQTASGRLLATLFALPAVGSTKPITADAKPITADAKPITAGAKPITAGAKPITATAKPIVAYAKPILASAKPITADAKPITADAKDLPFFYEYLVTTPEGYYTGSAQADRYVPFRLGNDLFPAESFRSRYRRSDLVRRTLAGQPLPLSSSFRGAYPPVAGILSPATGVAVPGKSDSITLAVQATDDDAIGNVVVLVNGARVKTKRIGELQRSITPTSPPLLAARKALPAAHTVCRFLKLRVPVPLDATLIKLQMVAFDGDGLQSRREVIFLRRNQTVVVPGKLLVLCVGVKDYKNPKIHDLKYADHDARELANLLHKVPLSQRSLYNAAQVMTLTNKQATAAGVNAALDKLAAQAKPVDTILILLSGHGWRSDEQSFYFATHDFSFKDLSRTALAWQGAHGVVQRLRTLSEKSKRVIVLLDACYSGSSATNEELLSAMSDVQTGVLVVTSSNGSELSWELDAPYRHGAFTEAILEAIYGNAAWKRRNSITLDALLDYVYRRVVGLTNDSQHPDVLGWSDFNIGAEIVRW